MTIVVLLTSDLSILDVKDDAMVCLCTALSFTPSYGTPLIGAGDGPETECERCGKLGTPRQQFEHMGVTICFLCADERVAELGAEGPWA